MDMIVTLLTIGAHNVYFSTYMNLHGIKNCLLVLVFFSALLSHGSAIAGTCSPLCRGEHVPIVSQNDFPSLHSLIDSMLTSTADTNDPTDTAEDNLSRRWGWIEFGAGLHTHLPPSLLYFMSLMPR